MPKDSNSVNQEKKQSMFSLCLQDPIVSEFYYLLSISINHHSGHKDQEAKFSHSLF